MSNQVSGINDVSQFEVMRMEPREKHLSKHGTGMSESCSRVFLFLNSLHN